MVQGSKRTRACAVCVWRDQLLCVQLRDPSTRIARLFPPGGAVEPGETAADAAVRETAEETGYRVRLQPRPPVVAHYPYTWNGHAFDVITHFFAADLADPHAPPAPVQDASYLEATRWIALSDVPGALRFNRDILAAVQQLLRQPAQPDQKR